MGVWRLLKRMIDPVVLFYRLSLSSEVPIRSASLAFTTILSVVPILTIIFAIFANFEAFHSVQVQLEEFLLGVLLPKTSATLRDVFKQFASNSGKLTAIGFLSLFVTTASVFLDLNNMVNRIWQVRTRRTLLQNLTIFWLCITLGPFLLGTSFILSGELGEMLHSFFPTIWLFARTGQVISWAAGFLLLYLMFVILPHTHVPKLRAALAVVATQVMLEALNTLFTFWYGRFTNYSAIYGSLSAVPLFFLWMYLNWYVILMGVQFSRFLAHRRDPDEELRNSRLASPELAIALALGERSLKQEGGLPETELASLVPVHADRFQLGLDHLCANKIIDKAGDHWVLVASPDHISLKSLVSFELPRGEGPEQRQHARRLAGRMKWVEGVFQRSVGNRSLKDLLSKEGNASPPQNGLGNHRPSHGKPSNPAKKVY